MTFRGGMSYIEKSRPAMVLMENVKELEQRDPHDVESRSDAEVVVKELEDMGYSADFVRFDAACYGSWAHRVRIYFFAFEGSNAEQRARCRMVKRILAAMEIGGGKARDVIMQADELEKYVRLSPPQKKFKGEESKVQYKSEHMDIYAAANLQWPPRFTDTDGARFNFGGMTPRMQEVAWFVHFAFPVEDSAYGVWQASGEHNQTHTSLDAFYIGPRTLCSGKFGIFGYDPFRSPLGCLFPLARVSISPLACSACLPQRLATSMRTSSGLWPSTVCPTDPHGSRHSSGHLRGTHGGLFADRLAVMGREFAC